MGFPRTEEALERAGYKFEGTGKCKSEKCKQEIAWYRTPKGRFIPLDEGTLKPHWETCPDASKFR